MAVTIKQIAEVCGVSRGTVDRVLNSRGNVRPETEQLIRKVAKELGYAPNFAAKALAARKKSYKIGIVLSSIGNPFFDELIRGIDHAANDLETYGVTVEKKLMKGYDPQKQLELIESLEKEVNILLINPVDDPIIIDKINQLSDIGVAVVTINTDIENSSRILYIGSDYYNGGRTACGMMSFITSSVANIGIVQGSDYVLGHRQRLAGFKNQIDKHYKNLKITAVVSVNDDDIIAFSESKKMLENNPDMDAIFIVAGGSYGAMRAVEEFMPQRNIKVVCFDTTPNNIEMLKKGVVQAVIDQEPFIQGSTAVQKAFEYLISGALPTEPLFITKNEIKIRENTI